MAEDREGALARWSRLKRRQRPAAGRGAAAPVGDVPDRDPVLTPVPDGGPAVPAEAHPTGDDAGPSEDAARDLPPIDGLDKDSDYTPFLAEGVPEKLARAALRKMWMSDPAFGIRDGLDDYDEDFSLLHEIADAVTAKAKSAGTPKKAAKKTKEKKAKETAAGETKKIKKPKTAKPAKKGGAKAGRRKKGVWVWYGKRKLLK